MPPSKKIKKVADHRSVPYLKLVSMLKSESASRSQIARRAHQTQNYAHGSSNDHPLPTSNEDWEKVSSITPVLSSPATFQGSMIGTPPEFQRMSPELCNEVDSTEGYRTDLTDDLYDDPTTPLSRTMQATSRLLSETPDADGGSSFSFTSRMLPEDHPYHPDHPSQTSLTINPYSMDYPPGLRY